MKLFECNHCGQLLHFENVRCERCGRTLGFLWQANALAALVAHGNDQWSALDAGGGLYRFCRNANLGACNWLVKAEEANPFCRACRLNRTIPDLSLPENLLLWQRVESAKHRLIYSLLRLELPLIEKHADPQVGLAFDFLAGPNQTSSGTVLTGHMQGIITINISESDAATRERERDSMSEPYRTLLGHFRHEIGHYFWARLVSEEASLMAFREQFGDERKPYQAALDTHYRYGPPGDWQQRCVSGYASCHPWEDWAETWAHYLHMVDTLETAYAFGLKVAPRTGNSPTLDANFDPYRQTDFNSLVQAWFPLTCAVNGLNRSMGQPDLYPFVLSPIAIEKLHFVHQTIQTSITTLLA